MKSIKPATWQSLGWVKIGKTAETMTSNFATQLRRAGYEIKKGRKWGQAQVFKYFYQEESHEGQVLTLDIREETGGQDWD